MSEYCFFFFYVLLIKYFLGFYFIARYNMSSSFLFDESNQAGKKVKRRRVLNLHLSDYHGALHERRSYKLFQIVDFCWC